MSLLECQILILLLKQNQRVKIGVSKHGTHQYAIVGAINRLRSYGFLISETGNFQIGTGVENTLQDLVALSDFGINFIQYCLD